MSKKQDDQAESQLFLAAMGDLQHDARRGTRQATTGRGVGSQGNEPSKAKGHKPFGEVKTKFDTLTQSNLASSATLGSSRSVVLASNSKQVLQAPAQSQAAQNKESVDTDEDVLLYKELCDVTPLQGKERIALPPALQEQLNTVESNLMLEALESKLDFSLSGSDECLEGHVLGLDLLTVGKLQARHYSPEAHLDLHGLNSEQAFHALVGFFKSAYYNGIRVALVVTGRGRNSPDGTAVLRSKAHTWLTQEPFRRVVLAFCTAKPEDGGLGALYVLLRKYKKKQGKVQWDRMPADVDLF